MHPHVGHIGGGEAVAEPFVRALVHDDEIPLEAPSAAGQIDRDSRCGNDCRTPRRSDAPSRDAGPRSACTRRYTRGTDRTTTRNTRASTSLAGTARPPHP